MKIFSPIGVITLILSNIIPAMATDSAHPEQSLVLSISEGTQSIAADQRKSADSSLELKFAFKNTGKANIRILDLFDPEYFPVFFRLYATRVGGAPVPNIPMAGKVSLLEKGTKYRSVKPGETFEVAFPLNTILPEDMAPGEYDAWAIYTNQYGDGCFKGEIKSAPVRIIVPPKK